MDEAHHLRARRPSPPSRRSRAPGACCCSPRHRCSSTRRFTVRLLTLLDPVRPRRCKGFGAHRPQEALFRRPRPASRADDAQGATAVIAPSGSLARRPPLGTLAWSRAAPARTSPRPTASRRRHSATAPACGGGFSARRSTGTWSSRRRAELRAAEAVLGRVLGLGPGRSLAGLVAAASSRARRLRPRRRRQPVSRPRSGARRGKAAALPRAAGRGHLGASRRRRSCRSPRRWPRWRASGRGSRGDGIEALGYHGDLPLVERDRQVARFRDPTARGPHLRRGRRKVRNFQFAHHLVNYDLPWSPATMEQRIGRLDRIGQTQRVDIHVFDSRARSPPTCSPCWPTPSASSARPWAGSTRC